MKQKRQKHNYSRFLVKSDQSGNVEDIKHDPVKPNDMPDLYARCLLSGFEHVAKLNQTQLRVLVAIINNLDKKSGCSLTTQKEIAAETGIKPPHVSTALGTLIAGNFIQRAKFGKVDVFVVSPEIAVCGGYKRGVEIWLEAMPPSPKRDADLKASRQGRSKKVRLAFGTITDKEIAENSREAIGERLLRKYQEYAAQRVADAA